MTNVARIYVVKAGDTLPSIAAAAYGDASYSSAIANSNGIKNDAILPIGSRLALPSVDATLGADDNIETLVVTKDNAGKTYYGPGPVVSNTPWYKDWKTYAIGGLVLGGLWLLFRKK